MAPYRPSKGAAFRIDKVIPGVGRIALSSGTTHAPTFRRILEMLDGLKERGRLDILAAIRSRTLTPLQVYEAYRVGELERLPSADLLHTLATALTGFVGRAECSEKHRGTMKSAAKRLAGAVPADATIVDLPRAVKLLREEMKATPRMFNYLRSTALAFARDHAGRGSKLWLEVANVEPRKVKPSRPRTPLSPEQMRNWFPNPERDPVDAIAWGMATTGMGQGEYWGAWAVLADRVHVAGTKREGRVRDVPLVWHPAVPTLHHRTFEDKVRERTNRGIKPYDLRRTYANWLEAAGITRTRRRLYMGHGAGDVTGIYELHEVTAFLADDAAKLRRFLGLNPEPTPSLKLEAK